MREYVQQNRLKLAVVQPCAVGSCKSLVSQRSGRQSQPFDILRGEFDEVRRARNFRGNDDTSVRSRAFDSASPYRGPSLSLSLSFVSSLSAGSSR